MALADLVLVLVEITVVKLDSTIKSMQDDLFQSQFSLDSEQARKLDQQRIRACRYYYPDHLLCCVSQNSGIAMIPK
jgi:hypothetical protein